MDFTTNLVESYYSANANVVGLSMYFPEVLPYWSNDLFRARMNVSLFEYSYSNAFYQVVHVPKGYKYNCSSALYSNANVTCILDLSRNTTLTTQMYNFMRSTAGIYSFDLGFDIEKSNFTNTNFMSNFKTYMNIFLSNAMNLELIDFGDQIQAIYNRTYTVTNFLADMSTIYNQYAPLLYTNGPGITEAADSSWVS
jgi:hypothetical protein